MSLTERRRVTIVDYGIGNLGSLKGAFDRVGARTSVGRTRDDFAESDCIVLPGVGSARFAMERLRETGLDDYVSERFAAGDVPIIGICLGMQLMYDWSQEGDTVCLGLIPGKTIAFADGDCHVGWNIVHPVARVDAAKAYYFNHSYHVKSPPDTLLGTTTYGGVVVAAMVRSRRFVGIQFHPEKSQLVGQSLLGDLIGSA